METTDGNTKSDAMTSESESEVVTVPTDEAIMKVDRLSEPQQGGYEIKESLPPIVEDYLKRITAISVGVIFLSVVMMMVTGGRLASQVDGLQAATLSLTKRVVNMNSALEQVSVLDSKLELLDLGHASLIDSNSEAGKTYSEALEVFGSKLSKLETSIQELDVNAQNAVEKMGGIAESLSIQEQSVNNLAAALTSLETRVSSLKRLERDIQMLVEIEQGNLKELFQQQLELAERELQQGKIHDGARHETEDPVLDGVVSFSTTEPD